MNKMRQLIFIEEDKRCDVSYKEFFKVRIFKGSLAKIKLFDPTIREYRKQIVQLDFKEKKEGIWIADIV